ncbi:hypothetical protein PT2222_250163 [Paraburkholderia tropica]
MCLNLGMDKSNPDLDASRIIDDLGGTGDVARLFDLSDAAVSQWRRNGIPRPWLRLIRLTRPDLFGVPRAASDSPDQSGSSSSNRC